MMFAAAAQTGGDLSLNQCRTTTEVGVIVCFYFAGGSKSLNGYGRVRLHEQRHEMPVQIRRAQSVHVRVSCR